MTHDDLDLEDETPPDSEPGAGRRRSEPPPRLARRDLLQVGMLGIAGSLAGVRELAAASPAAPPEPTPPETAAPCRPTVAAVPAIGAGEEETWNEPWVWRPGDWPGQQLQLNVVENQNPGVAVGLGNPGSVLFSYAGDTPGPTIRMRGDETLAVKLRNLLREDFGDTFVGPFPHEAPTQAVIAKAKAKATALGNYREDFCLGEHTNGVHSVRVTNLHTHGLHVRPGRNPDGTHSDNVILRVLSQADFRRREREGAEQSCGFLRNPEELYFLRDDEVAGEADYEFRLGDVQRRRREREGNPPQPHPSGTFWYHPHAHGATHNQVASGMAGFLLVEGDVEEAINRVLVRWKEGEPVPDPSLKTGPYDYRERLMFMQRVLNLSTDKDASKRSPELRTADNFTALVNGGSTPTVIRMRPGAVERWRVLNGSVDGRGYKRFMVVKGQYTVRDAGGSLQTFEVLPDGALVPITIADLEALEGKKQDLFQLAVDGVTLVRRENGKSRYIVKDLSKQNAGTVNPLWHPEPECLARLGAWIRKQGYDPETLKAAEQGADLLCRLFNVWKSPTTVKNCFVRPNEFYMGPANRTDLFFQAPGELGRKDPETGTRYEVYTVLAKTVVVHSDTPQAVAQDKVLGRPPGAPSPEDVIVAYVLVENDPDAPPVPASKMADLMRELEHALPPVQEYLEPVGDRELVVTPAEVRARSDLRAGDHRTRRVLYSGWGHPSMPLVSTFPLQLGDPPRPGEPPTARALVDYINRDPLVTIDGKRVRKHENLIYAEHPEGSGYYVVLPPEIRTMAISFDNARVEEERRNTRHPDDPPFLHPGLPRKFNPTDPYRARMLEDTAEEWSLYNLTDTLWGNTTTATRSATDAADGSDDPTSPDYRQPPTQYLSHYVAFPISRRRGREIFLDNPYFQAVSRGIDHPFHVHQNPFWVTRIEIPDETGELVNILDEPRWMDSIWIPRNRGRVVFRMRFPDFVGAYVHHCHILLHEDNGMMHVIEATPFADESNFRPSKTLDVDRNAPRPRPEEAYTLSYTFYDPDETTGQLYPGFDVTPPELDG
jgi:FtsP/CotA-like multicopper oxidase with cupredoxin domain